MLALFTHLFCDDGEIARSKSEIARDLYIAQPELYRISALINMDVGRLVALVAEEVEPVTLPARNSRHAYPLLSP